MKESKSNDDSDIWFLVYLIYMFSDHEEQSEKQKATIKKIIDENILDEEDRKKATDLLLS